MFNRLFKNSTAPTSLVLFAALATLSGSRLFGQPETGRITGIAFDPSSAAIPNASITIRSLDTGSNDRRSLQLAAKLIF
jgi:hypothetical protein